VRAADSETVKTSEDQEAVEELKANEDPTILKRGVWLDTEWNKYRDGSNNVDETLGVLWAWPVSTNQDWAARLKIPYRFHSAGDAPRDTDNHGLGDIKVATGTAIRLNKSWRVGGGLELRTPSGADDRLSEDVWRIQEFGAIAWDATDWLTLSPSLEYNQSIAEERGAPPQHFLEVFFPATFILPNRWAAAARYELKADFQNDNYITHSAKFAVSKQLVEDVPLNAALSFKKSFDGGAREFQVNFLLIYYFSSGKNSGSQRQIRIKNQPER